MQFRPVRAAAVTDSTTDHSHRCHDDAVASAEAECSAPGQESPDSEAAFQERVVSSEVQWLQEQWQVFQHKEHDLPPDLLPFEKLASLPAFHGFIDRLAAVPVGKKAFDAFAEHLGRATAASLRVWKAIKARLPRPGTDLLTAVRRLSQGRRVSKLLRTCRVELAPPHLGSPEREALISASKLIRGRWSDDLAHEFQAVISVHRSASGTILQIGSGSHGCIYVTLNDSLDPVAFARKLLTTLVEELEGLFKPNSVFTCYDGDLGGLNPKQFLSSHRVVRCIHDDLLAVRERLPRVLAATAPSPADTSLHIGVPASESELAAVFPSDDGQDWNSWEDVAPEWTRRSRDRGFEEGMEASSQAVIEALTSKRNVIVVVAHADGQIIHLPAPPPKGSTIGPEEIEAHRDAIAANKPFVYLFCCETAQISELGSFAEKLLECGAAAVVAPQTQIGAVSSADLFDALVSREGEQANMLVRLQSAEAKTNYREMEVWIG